MKKFLKKHVVRSQLYIELMGPQSSCGRLKRYVQLMASKVRQRLVSNEVGEAWKTKNYLQNTKLTFVNTSRANYSEDHRL